MIIKANFKYFRYRNATCDQKPFKRFCICVGNSVS